jgi:hypothetical protein
MIVTRTSVFVKYLVFMFLLANIDVVEVKVFTLGTYQLAFTHQTHPWDSSQQCTGKFIEYRTNE